MKFKKPNKKTAIDALAVGGGAVVGGSLSKGMNSYLPAEQNAKIGSKLAIAAVAFMGMASISTNDTASQLVKGSLLGVGAEKAIGAIHDYAKTTSLATADATDKPLTQFAQDALGLSSCGCTATPTKRIIMPTLNYASRQLINMVETAPNKYTAESFA